MTLPYSSWEKNNWAQKGKLKSNEQQSNSEALKSQALLSSNVSPGHSCFFSGVPWCLALWQNSILSAQPVHSLGLLPGACTIEQRNGLCSCLQKVAASFSGIKRSLLCLAPDWFNLTRYWFFSKFFCILESASCFWPCVKQHNLLGRLVSLLASFRSCGLTSLLNA